MIMTVQFNEPEKQRRFEAIIQDFDFEKEYFWMK